jgi:hypothetical protein
LGITGELLRPHDASGMRSRQVEPHVRVVNILRHALPQGIHLTESELRNCEVLVSGAAKPLCSLGVVLRDNLAKLVHGTENILRKGAAFVSMFTKPL